ncbi:MAG: hypothetical protein AAF270_06405 [Pseudomonadota bacterium]
MTLALIAGCASVGESTAPVVGGSETDNLRDRQPAPGSHRYQIVSGESEIRVLTFRDGPMARFGHNHVVNSTRISGSVWLGDDLSAALTRIVVPTDSLSVDDPALRAEEGEQFADPIPEDAIAGTRANMLGDALLNAAQFNFIRVTCADYQSQFELMSCEIDLAGVTTTLKMPVDVQIDDNQIRATGEVTVSHEQLGLTPFSAAGGAIRVADGMTLRYNILAQRLSE